MYTPQHIAKTLELERFCSWIGSFPPLWKVIMGRYAAQYDGPARAEQYTNRFSELHLDIAVEELARAYAVMHPEEVVVDPITGAAESLRYSFHSEQGRVTVKD